MEQTLSSIQSSLVEEISSSKNEPQWLKEYRKNYTKNKIIKLKEFFLSIFDSKNSSGWFSCIFLHYGPHLIFLILFLGSLRLASELTFLSI